MASERCRCQDCGYVFAHFAFPNGHIDDYPATLNLLCRRCGTWHDVLLPWQRPDLPVLLWAQPGPRFSAAFDLVRADFAIEDYTGCWQQVREFRVGPGLPAGNEIVKEWVAGLNCSHCAALRSLIELNGASRCPHCKSTRFARKSVA